MPQTRTFICAALKPLPISGYSLQDSNPAFAGVIAGKEQETLQAGSYKLLKQRNISPKHKRRTKFVHTPRSGPVSLLRSFLIQLVRLLSSWHKLFIEITPRIAISLIAAATTSLATPSNTTCIQSKRVFSIFHAGIAVHGESSAAGVVLRYML